MHRQIWLFFVLNIILLASLSSQHTNLEQTHFSIDSFSNDSLTNYLKLANNNLDTKLPQRIQYLQLALKQAQKKAPQWQAHLYLLLGQQYFLHGQYEPALLHLNRSRLEFDTLSNTLQAELYSITSHVYFSLDMYEEASKLASDYYHFGIQQQRYQDATLAAVLLSRINLENHDIENARYWLVNAQKYHSLNKDKNKLLTGMINIQQARIGQGTPKNQATALSAILQTTLKEWEQIPLKDSRWIQQAIIVLKELAPSVSVYFLHDKLESYSQLPDWSPQFTIPLHHILIKKYFSQNGFSSASKMIQYTNHLIKRSGYYHFYPDMLQLQAVLKHVKHEWPESFQIQQQLDSLQRLKTKVAFLAKRQAFDRSLQGKLLAYSKEQEQLQQTNQHFFSSISRATSYIIIVMILLALIFGYTVFFQRKGNTMITTGSIELETEEKELKLKFAQVLFQVAIVFVSIIFIYFMLWGKPISIWLTLIALVVMYAIYRFGKIGNLRLVYFLLVGIIYPLAIVGTIANGSSLSLPIAVIAIFIVATYLIPHPNFHFLNIGLACAGLIIRYFLKGFFPISTLFFPEGVELLVNLGGLMAIVVTLVFFNQNIIDFKLALRQRNQFLQQISNINPHLIFTKDKQQRFSYVNSSVAQLFNAKSSQILGKHSHEVMPTPKSIQFLDDGDELVLQSGREITYREQILDHPSGHQIWIDGLKKPIFNNKKEIIGLFAVATDITEKVTSRIALEKSEIKYKTLIHASPSGIVKTDINGNVTFASPRAIKIFGYHAHDHVLGTNLKDFVRAEDHEKISVHFEQLFSNKEEVISEQMKCIHALGHTFVVEGNASLVRDPQTQEVELLLVFNDITEREKNRAALIERHAIYKSLIEHSFDGIDIIEIVKEHEPGMSYEGQLIVRNPVMNQLVMGSKDPFISYNSLHHISSLYRTEEEYRFHLRNHIKALITNRHLRFNWQIKRKDGSIVDLAGMSHLIHLNGKKLFIRIVKDITQEKKQQKIINQQLQKLNEKHLELKKYIASNLELENFAYVASHDLQAPIRTIISFSQLLKKSLGDQLNKQQTTYMQFIHDATLNMHELINDLLDYSKVNNSSAKKEAIETNTLIQSVLHDLQSAIRHTQANIQMEQLPTTILGDRIKIRQLFQNLIGNAIKFAKPHSVPVVTIGGQENTDETLFWVRDNGIGIDPAFFDRIFLLFKRLHGSTDYEGTGIGLALCKKIVEQHQGKIWVESEKNNGTTFFFTLKNAVENSVISV